MLNLMLGKVDIPTQLSNEKLAVHHDRSLIDFASKCIVY